MAKVLVVEDDPDIRMLLEVRLRQSGHLVLSAGSGEEALTVLAERGAPDIAVLDVMMPGMSGLELLRLLQATPEYANLPAIFLSGRVNPDDIAAGHALGGIYLTKPIVLTALNSAIEKALQPLETGTW